MSQPTSSYSSQLAQMSNQFKVPPPNMNLQLNSGNMYNHHQMNAAYYAYGGYPSADQWGVPSQNYYFNSWSYPQASSTPPATLMQTPRLSSSGQLPGDFNPAQPPPLPKEVLMPPPPPPDPLPSPNRGRSVYPRGGAAGGRNKGPNRQSSGATLNFSPITPTNKPESANGEDESSTSPVNTPTHQTQIHKKPKRKPMSARYPRRRTWSREDAERVIELENQKSMKTPSLVIHFPDPELNSNMVKGFSSAIDAVHFQLPYKGRSCFVKLKPDSDVAKVCEEIGKIPFGQGYLRAEEKHRNQRNDATSLEDVDPYTLYVGNLPPYTTIGEIRVEFPNAVHIDVGFAQKIRYTRYAFIQYATVEEAMAAYCKGIDVVFDKRNLVVRFRRSKGNIGLAGDDRLPSAKKSKLSNDSDCEIINDDVLPSPTPLEDDDCEIIGGNKMPSPGQLRPFEADSKENVMKEAAQLMRKVLEKNKTGSDAEDDQSERSSSTSPGDEGPLVSRIKTEKEDFDEDDYLDENDLLGTQVKDEPLDDYLENDFLEMNEEEDDDEIPPEERYDTMNQMDDDSYEEPDTVDDDDIDVYGPRHWERERQKELEETDEKPDIQLLQRPASSLGGMKSSDLQFHDKPAGKKDDLDDLFNAMNPESDDDDL